jgi:hypothetical protein
MVVEGDACPESGALIGELREQLLRREDELAEARLALLCADAHHANVLRLALDDRKAARERAEKVERECADALFNLEATQAKLAARELALRDVADRERRLVDRERKLLEGIYALKLACIECGNTEVADLIVQTFGMLVQGDGTNDDSTGSR